jgi:putative transposase
MPQTHLALHYHLVFHTKENRPSIRAEWKYNLHAFLGGCLKTGNAIPIAIGGTDDHVHLLIGLCATHTLADVVKDIKVASSKWVHQELGHKLFGWQNGYGAFTVGTPQLENVRRYVLNQEEHHRKRSVKEEYIAMLTMAGVEYDEKYVW